MIRPINSNGTFRANLFEIPLAKLVTDNCFQLIEVRENKATDSNGKALDTIVAHTYSIFIPDLYATINIKVDGSVPVISAENLAASSSDVFVKIPIDKSWIRPYKIEYGQAYATIKAPFIELVVD